MPTPARVGWRGRLASGALLLAASLAGASGNVAVAAPTVLPEVPVSGLDERLQLAHNSPLLAADPTRSRFVVLANRLDNPDFGCTLHLSGDGGRGWIPVKPVPKLPPKAEKCYAPEVAFDADGLLYYSFIALAGQGNSPSGTYLVTSDDRGRTFSPPRQVLGPERYMVRMAMDRTMGPKGRLHFVWLEAGTDPPLGGLAPPPNPLMAAWSDDGGRSFSTPVRVSDPQRRVVAPALALGPDHTVHVAYYDLEDDFRDYQGLEGPTWEGNWSIRLSTSTDGGKSFAAAVTIDGDLVPPERVMLIYTMPPPALAVGPLGGLHAAWYDARNGDWDVFARRSVDGGRTWAPPVRVNDDPVGNGRHQYLPRLSVAPDGRVDALFLDRRADPENVRNHTFLASSSDGGAGFEANVQVTTEASNATIGTRYDIPSALGLVEYGSRLGLLSLPNRTLAAWPDTRNGEIGEYSQDVYATEVAFGPPSAAGVEERGAGGGGSDGLPLGAVGAAIALVAAAAVVLRRRRPAAVAAADDEAPSGQGEGG
jgi:hypothetical protein